MQITLDPEFRAYVLDLMAKREARERTGTHVSDLIYCLNKQAMRRLHPKPPTPREQLLFSLGWATQRWLTGQDKDEDEVEVDGIKVTMDSKVEGCPWELKATFQSSAKPIEENIHWVRQIMAQCYVSKTKTARLTRLEIMGNWKSVFGKKEDKDKPENEKMTLHAYRLEFTDTELLANWRWLLLRKPLFEKALAEDKYLPKNLAVAPEMQFECEYCAYKKECDDAQRAFAPRP